MSASTTNFTSCESLLKVKEIFSRFTAALNKINVQHDAFAAKEQRAMDESLVHESSSLLDTIDFDLNVSKTGNANLAVVNAESGNDFNVGFRCNNNAENQSTDETDCTIGDTIPPMESLNQKVYEPTTTYLDLGADSNRAMDVADFGQSQVIDVLPLNADNQIMNVVFPSDNFMCGDLEYLNNETSPTSIKNFFYYLYDHNETPDETDYTILRIGDTIPPMESLNQKEYEPTTTYLDLGADSNRAMDVADFGQSQVIDVLSLNADNQIMNVVFPSDNFMSGDLEYLKKIDAAKQKENDEEENDECDEKIFDSIAENSNNIMDTEINPEVRNDLRSILDTLNERGPEDSASTNESVFHDAYQAELDNHLHLSAERLIGSCDTTNMFVRTSDQKCKKLACPYCMKLVCKLARHLEMMHKNEKDVKKFMSFQKGSKMRQFIQSRIRINGMLKWNTDPSKSGKELIVSRRPNPKWNKKATDYLICPNCMSVHTLTNLRNHFSKCTGGAFKGQRHLKILSRTIEGRIAPQASLQLREVIPVMREDVVVHLIRYDSLLIVYGNLLCLKYHFHFQQNMIRAKLRLAGRVLQAMKIINADVTDFASIYQPKRYKQLIEAIKVVGKFNPATNEFGVPATAASALTLIKQIGSVLKCEYIESEVSEYVKKTDDFLYLMESQFSSVISKRVKESQQQRRREKNHKIPSKNDVRVLTAFLTRERKACFEDVTTSFSVKNWIKLLELTIVSLIVFNRRRVGEMQNILVSDFERREFVESSNQELFESLSDEAKKIARRFSRMKIRGKKGSNVNVLLKTELTQCIELVLNHRVEAGVSPVNPFLFALPSSPFDNRIKVVNACNVLATISTKCGAEDPSTLRGTNLRKHFATTCMAMELNDDMVAEVAKFMGHKETVHRESYRHNTIDREVVKIANLLESAQGIQKESGDSDSDDEDEGEYVIVPEATIRATTKKRKDVINGVHIINGKINHRCPSVVNPTSRAGKKMSAAKKTLAKQNAVANKKTVTGKRTEANEKKEPMKKNYAKSAVGREGKSNITKANKKTSLFM